MWDDVQIAQLVTQAARVLAPVFEREGWLWDTTDGRQIVPSQQVIGLILFGLVEQLTTQEPEAPFVWGGSGRLLLFRYRDEGRTRIRVALDLGEIVMEESPP